MKRTRFTQTVSHYAKYRPGYPQAVIDLLIDRHVIGKETIVADIGSGTGIFSKMLLEAGASVWAVEPDEAMRDYAAHQLRHFPNHTTVDASAEQTTLASHSVDMVTVATAFHWFDHAQCRQEFLRILKPKGWVVLLWNLRNPSLSTLSADYEALLKRHCPTYKGIPSDQFAETEILTFFGSDDVETASFANHQYFDLDGFIGRLRSTSYALTPDQTGYQAMIDDAKQIFAQHQQHDQVTFDYVTKLYLGRLS